MAKNPYPGFDGWTVEHEPSRNEFTFTKPHEAGKNGRLLVVWRGGTGTDPEIVYLAGRQAAYAEDVRVATAADAPTQQAKHVTAYRDVVAGKVRRHVAKMRGRGDTEAAISSYAVERLTAAGFDLIAVPAFLKKEG